MCKHFRISRFHFSFSPTNVIYHRPSLSSDRRVSVHCDALFVSVLVVFLEIIWLGVWQFDSNTTTFPRGVGVWVFWRQFHGRSGDMLHIVCCCLLLFQLLLSSWFWFTFCCYQCCCLSLVCVVYLGVLSSQFWQLMRDLMWKCKYSHEGIDDPKNPGIVSDCSMTSLNDLLSISTIFMSAQCPFESWVFVNPYPMNAKNGFGQTRLFTHSGSATR